MFLKLLDEEDTVYLRNQLANKKFVDGKKTQAGIPCLLSLDIKPRSDGLYITAFYRSMRISKSGYADFKGLVELGKFISYRSELRLKRITIMGSSVHLGSQNGEMVNTKKLLGMI